jgi:glutathione S-transferase
VTRFRTYKIKLEREAEAYCETITTLPAMQEWIAAARNEPMIIEKYEF